MRYRIVGNHTVAQTRPGGYVNLDPDDPNTTRLIRGGHIAPAPQRKKRGGADDTPEGDD